ncbi:MAG: hypothetical protein KGQ36_05045 [Rickettsiales bacterium]|nr:hypothetical protein [Rickettsiales bacterium]
MQVEKNNSKENQENKSRSLVKKLSFLWVILLTITAHFIVYYSDLKGPSRGAWFFCVWVFGIGISRYCYLYYNNSTFKRREIDSFKLGRGWKVINIIRSDKTQYSKVLSDVVDFWDITPGGSFSVVYAIKYKFKDKNQKEFFGLKRIGNWNYVFSPDIPKAGNKIEILYNKNDPTDSVIFYQKAKKAKWYQWQPKYEIKVIKQ